MEGQNMESYLAANYCPTVEDASTCEEEMAQSYIILLLLNINITITLLPIYSI